MKKVLILMCVSLLLVGCGNNKEVKYNVDTSTTTTETTTTTTTTTETTTTTTTTTQASVQKLVCTSNDFYGNGDNVKYKGEYTFKDGKITKYVYKLTVPDKYDPNDYYVEEQKGNMGRYQMSLSGRVITFTLTSKSGFWKEWPGYNKSIDEIKNNYEDSKAKCSIK